MIVIILRTLIVFVFLLIGLRLMGKRQIGELQPFEFVITLIVAELACTPMQDISIPIGYGIIPLTTVFVFHYFITLLSTKSIKFRKILNGKPMVLINEKGLDFEVMSKMNMDVNDVLSSLRGLEYFSIPEVSYAIIETNGNISAIPNDNAIKPKSIPLAIIVEGKIVDENIKLSNTTRQQVLDMLEKHNIKLKNCVLFTTESNNIFIQPREQQYITEVLA